MRVFVALFPPAPAIADLESLVSRLHLGKATAAGRDVRLDPPERWHVTLAFLGEVDDAGLAAAEGAVGRVAEAWPQEHAGVPPLRLADGGRFGTGPSTILWAGLHGDLGRLTDLAGQVDHALADVGLPSSDGKPFRPHLTLARCGDRLSTEEVAADLAQLHQYAGPTWKADELVLVRSHLGDDPRYERLRSWPLS
ncbi:MAG: RNA 2',3'-cyclic phosphodiesterase [Hamadaea sp.]|uniref:RNA 2',3'-cyclic phosphodiesterase n=1 Tax=Hamadaea sp. TaxID=2024425 RepID=UPI001801597A|nr:RNA 2',3'-cyclic phosphodiesterase [Hamadaea sp.]NUR70028.1 RNA 2',3'-cyclic phosphodiesterase [Hamadaea sp.]NUT19337.1 RNA 2',3'-cyclic phosphodiesterase [Hamadaea sp.]